MNAAPDRNGRPAEDIARDLRELALVDKIIGLEAENARLAIRLVTPAGPAFGYERRVNELLESRTWRVGRVVLAPVRAGRWIAAKILRKQG